ncbi:MAG TPA: peptidoglycan-associated lipoprotein Pal [Candidatus Sulfotelmatobacter sp.]|nr:peptidoglycan-associated lipoprotein Pal [Candidatus Sulfotelmatobacter sp.]
MGRTDFPTSWAIILASGLALAGCAAERPKETSAGVPPATPRATAPMPVSPRAPGTPEPPPEIRVAPLPRAPQGEDITVERTTPGSEPAAPTRSEAKALELKDVFFDYDRATIPEGQNAALNEDVNWLKDHAAARVTVEGHCDERGTAEYNLALGERRAKAVQDYLVAAGIAPDRITTVSYGEERPFVLGHDETAWRWNRRGHLVAQAQP